MAMFYFIEGIKDFVEETIKKAVWGVVDGVFTSFTAIFSPSFFNIWESIKFVGMYAHTIYCVVCMINSNNYYNG